MAAAVSRQLGDAAALASSDTSAGLIVCRYATRQTTSSTCTGASVTINTEPQAFKDFQRWVVETTQNSSSGSREAGLAPVTEAGVGLEADWVPATLTFEAGTPTRWVSVVLTCTARNSRQLPLAKRLAAVAIES